MSDQERSEWSDKIERVYREQGRELWALFYAHCCNADRAYDALQESFLRLQQQNGKDKKPILDPRAWLLRVGRNWLRDVARRQRVAAKPSEHLELFPDANSDTEYEVIRSELQQTIREALKQLKEQDREVLVLRYSLSWSSHRIAEVMDSTAAAIDMRLSRARKRLAELLEKAGVTND